jgi:hypothetical protein
MKSTERSSSPFDRLDAVRMTARDREQAKAMMRRAEAFATGVADLRARISDAAVEMPSAFVSFRARFRSAVRSALSQAAHR